MTAKELEHKFIPIGTRNAPLLKQFGTCDSFRYPIAGTRWFAPATLIFAHDFAGTHCDHEDDRLKLKSIIKDELEQGIYTRDFFTKIHKTFKDVLADIQLISQTDVTELSNTALAEHFAKFYNIYLVTFLPMMIGIYASDLQDIFEESLNSVLTEDERKSDRRIDILATLLTPPQLTLVQQEEQALTEIETELKKNIQPDATDQHIKDVISLETYKDALESLVTDFGWFHMEFVGEPHTIQQYKDELFERCKRQNIVPSPNELLLEAQEKQKNFFSTHEHTEYLEKISIALQEFALLLDYSKADLVYGIYLARPLLEEIAKRLDIESWILVRNLTPRELQQALERGTLTEEDKNNIEVRAKDFAVVYSNNEVTVYQGKEVHELKQQLLKQESVGDNSEFKGLTAMSGNVTGIVKVVRSNKDLQNFKDGNVLVVDEVSTEQTAILKKAIAIVADGGGIISHTAIVAREFKTPCIVGTKVATKVLKDGDMVEVDADNGVVKILHQE